MADVVDKQCPACGARTAISLSNHCPHGKCGWMTCLCGAVTDVRTGRTRGGGRQ